MDPNEWMKEFLQEDSDEKTAAPAEQPAQATPPQAPTAPAPAAPTPAAPTPAAPAPAAPAAPSPFIQQPAAPTPVAPTPAAPAPAAPVAAAPGSKDAPLGSIEAVADKWSAQVILKLPNPESFTMNDLLAALVFCRGSDLHLNIGVPPIFRIDGGLLKTTLCEMTPAMNERLIKVILNDQQRQILQQERQLDMAYALPKVGRFRVNCFYTRKGLCAVLRAIPLKIKSLEELGMLEVLKDIIEHPNGMVLVTGPTGSGKTTTLAAIVDYINQSKKHHIITIEDPVEFEHVSNNSLISQRQVGVDTDSFAAALRAALREDPDIILVGHQDHQAGHHSFRNRSPGAGHAEHQQRHQDRGENHRYFPPGTAEPDTHAAGGFHPGYSRTAARTDSFRYRAGGGTGNHGGGQRREKPDPVEENPPALLHHLDPA